MPAVDVRVVGVSGWQVDYPAVIARHLRATGLKCEHRSIPWGRLWGSRASLLREIRQELRATPAGALSIYCSGVTETYVREADLSLHFSAFRSWFDPTRMKVLPHHWGVSEPLHGQNLAWTRKPPLIVGFMGATYSDSRAVKLLSRMPLRVREWVLSGRHLRLSGAVAALYAVGAPVRYAMTFPRAQTLQSIRATRAETGVDVRIFETGIFTGSRDQVELFARHLEEVTYVLCPRGVENFSYRFYEALKFGRIPVLIDTDVVLPDGIDWDELMIRVPYSELDEIGEIIARDYRSHSTADFISRQKKALQAMAYLESGSWMDELADDVRLRLAAKSSRNPAKVLDSAATV